MHRFRKKSDAKKSQVFADTPFLQDFHLPTLPVGDSLILPDLSRRFSLLRNSSTGDPVTFEDLRTRFAEQRAKGAGNTISEEEEDILFETLGMLREGNSKREHADMEPTSSVDRQRQSVNTMHSATSSAGSRSTKRYSNNMFGSGRFRDYSYRTAVAKNGSGRSTISSMTHNETSMNLRGASAYSESGRPVTPENSLPSSSSTQSSPEHALSVAEYRLSKSLGPSVLKRASMALEEVLREIEEEAEEEIVMPRTAPTSRSPKSDHYSTDSREEQELSEKQPSPGTAISLDKDMLASNHGSPRASPIPARTIPGYYIPGMPRPMTPRSALEHDEQRSHSTTPRARSPSPYGSTDASQYASNIASSQYGSRSAPSPSYIPPLFAPRSAHGRYTPEDHAGDHDGFNGTRRRPVSPLSNTPYQPMAVSSRPGTPSNVTWNSPPTSPTRHGSHHRDGSWVSEGSDLHTSLDHGKSNSRSLRSPALPDSPMIDGPYTAFGSIANAVENRPPSSMSGLDLGSTSPPMHVAQPSPISPLTPSSPTTDRLSKPASRRSSKQNASSSTPFNSSNPLVFSPIANSSRSSLDSAGSSYHSWEAQSQKDRTLALFAETDTSQPAWHELSNSTATPGTSPDDAWDAEDTLARYAGLNRTDFFVIQEKLVAAANSKNAACEPHRAPSLRRRRPSTSQSNYSLNGRERIGSPPPQHPASPTRAAFDQAVASDLRQQNTEKTTTDPSFNGDMTSSRKNREVAKALFGLDPDIPEPIMVGRNTSTDTHAKTTDAAHRVPAPPFSPMTPSQSVPHLTAPIDSPYQLLRNPSTPKVPLSPSEQADLTKEVQRRTDAAMIALRKNPSNPKLVETGPIANKKRITPHQISTPRLVSASTSLETVPLRAQSLRLAPGSSTLGQRIKKLRGTLRTTKHTIPNGDEVTPFPLDQQSPTPQTANYPPNLYVSAATSATEPGPFRVPLASPPASAGPGLKSFMARFRGKQRSSDNNHPEPDRSMPQAGNISPSESRLPPSPNPSQLLSPFSLPQMQSPPQTPATPAFQHQPVSAPAPSNVDDAAALKQFFDAATNLGLNREALSEFVHRSNPSTSTKATEWSNLTRNNSTATAPRPDTRESNYLDRVHSPLMSEGRHSQDDTDDTIVRKLSVRKTPDSRRARESKFEASANAIIRRTIIFPSDPGSDLSSILRKSSTRRRRASGASVSSRSVQDRAPTPPPRSPTGRRFADGDGSPQPPLPPFPPSFSSQGDTMLNLPQGDTLGKQNSAYESLYDMYSEETKGSNLPEHSGQGNTSRDPEQGQAVEVIEMANGETIWSIVNGLRDSESMYGDSRASFSSENSRAGAVSTEGVQVFFKEHGRIGSKGSASSFLSRKKYNRPETKVFYSSSAKIGRLIEKLSTGMEAGSFNFQQQTGTSATSSFYDSTVEEQLQAMLGSMKT